MAYKRCGVVFNLENQSHADLYNWCCEQSSNFSDFARTLLFAYRESKISQAVARSHSPESISNQYDSGGVSFSIFDNYSLQNQAEEEITDEDAMLKML